MEKLSLEKLIEWVQLYYSITSLKAKRYIENEGEKNVQILRCTCWNMKPGESILAMPDDER